jgi:plasmid replication initiation protein
MIPEEKSIVKLTNLLNFTRQEFDVLGQKLMVLILEKLKNFQDTKIIESKSIELSFNFIDFEETNVERLKELADKITSKKIYYELEKDVWGYLVPIYRASYNRGLFTIKIADDVTKYYLDLAKGYTNINKKAIFALSSQYAIRIYELLSAFTNKGAWTVEVEKMRDLLDIKNNQYRSFSMFEKRILIYSQKELLEHCNLYFTWEISAKERKKITALTFHITTKDKQEKIELDNEIKQTIDYINNLKPFEIAQKIHMASTKYTLKPEQIDYITSNNKVFNEFIRIDLIIEAMIEKQKPPKDRTKYLAKSLGLDKVKFK